MADLKPQDEFSIVVTVVEGGPALLRCLTAIDKQTLDGQRLDVIIPYDGTIAEVGKLSGQFSRFRFLDMGDLVPAGAKLEPFLQHELFDKRRSVGLAAARGELVAMLEDRGAPRFDWVKAMTDEHAAHDADAIGGGVVNVAPGAMNRALFVCDYGRYFPPFVQGRTEYLTDINICYRREALELVRDVWNNRYQESAVNWALQDRGGRLWLSSKPLVLHARGPAPLSRTLSERMQWGRVFGMQRGARWSRSTAWASAAAAIALPLLLLIRQTRLLMSKGVKPAELVPTVGALMAVIPAWSLGEAIGYIQGLSSKRSRPIDAPARRYASRPQRGAAHHSE